MDFEYTLENTNKFINNMVRKKFPELGYIKLLKDYTKLFIRFDCNMLKVRKWISSSVLIDLLCNSYIYEIYRDWKAIRIDWNIFENANFLIAQGTVGLAVLVICHSCRVFNSAVPSTVALVCLQISLKYIVYTLYYALVIRKYISICTPRRRTT